MMMVLKQMNMTFFHVPTPEGFEIEQALTNNLTEATIAKKAFIALGLLATHILLDPFLDFNNSHYILRFRWYVPCSDKYPRWSSIFRLLSVELWLVLILSIVFEAISTTLVRRYSFTSEWQGYKTLTSSLINLWAVILWVSVSTMPCAPSLRSLFLAWVCFSVAFSTVFQEFLTNFLLTPSTKRQFKTWMCCLHQVLSLTTNQSSICFSIMVTKQIYQKFKEIVQNSKVILTVWTGKCTIEIFQFCSLILMLNILCSCL